MRLYILYFATLFWLALVPTQTVAQQMETFDRFEVYYSVVNTTFLNPEIASTYGIIRGAKRGILNLAVREKMADGSTARAMLLQGRTWDLIQNETLKFSEIREGDSIYYIAEFQFINEEWRFFEIDFRPTGSNETYTFKFKHQLYIN